MALETTVTRNPEEFLNSLLSPENRELLREHRLIYVRGSKGGKFIIFLGFSGTVREMHPDWEPGKPFSAIRFWCAYPAGIGSHSQLHAGAYTISMITQMLCIQADEDQYRNVAID